MTFYATKSFLYFVPEERMKTRLIPTGSTLTRNFVWRFYSVYTVIRISCSLSLGAELAFKTCRNECTNVRWLGNFAEMWFIFSKGRGHRSRWLCLEGILSECFSRTYGEILIILAIIVSADWTFRFIKILKKLSNRLISPFPLRK